MSKKSILIFVLSVSLCLFSVSPAIALTKGFEASSFHAAVDGGPYFSVYGTENLGQWQWVIGTMGTYAYRPFQIAQNGVRIRGIIDHDLVQDFHGAVGVVDRWLQFGIDIPVAWWLSYINPNVAAATAQNKVAFGDIQLNLKSELVQIKKHHVGLSLLPFILLPSGSGQYFNGNGGVSGGGKVLFEAMPFSRWRLALNAGVLARPYFAMLGTEQTNQLLYGFATAVDVTKKLSIAGEVTGRAKLSGLFKNKDESPVEAVGGLKLAIADSGVTLDAGGGGGLVRGSGAPSFRAFAGVAYRSKLHEQKEAEAAPAKPSLDDVRSAKIHFTFDNREFATLDDADALGRAADVLKQLPDVKVTIVGYADNSGNKRHNMALSQRRAEIVEKYLVQRGIARDRLTVIGKGDADPIADNKTREGRAANRRVEFRVTE